MGVDTGYIGDARAWFHVMPGVDLKVRNLTFDGNGHQVFQAFRHQGTGSFDNCHFRDINHPDNGAGNTGFAIVVFGRRVDVMNSTFEDFGNVALFYFNQLNVLVLGFAHGNRIIGQGFGALNYCIEISAGAVVFLERNYISNCAGQVDESDSAGVYVNGIISSGSAAIMVSNSLVDNRIGILMTGDSILDSQLMRIVGNDTGIQITGSSMPTLQYNWWGCNDGPNATGCDTAPMAATVVPWLILEASANPSTLNTSESTIVTADLTQTSTGVSTPGGYRVLNGTPVTFNSAPGTFCEPPSGTIDGFASSEYLPTPNNAAQNPSVTVDNQTVSAGAMISVAGGSFPPLSCTPLFADGFETLMTQ